MNHSIPRLRHLTPCRRRAYQLQAEGLEERQLLNAGDLDLSFDPTAMLWSGRRRPGCSRSRAMASCWWPATRAPTGTSGWSA